MPSSNALLFAFFAGNKTLLPMPAKITIFPPISSARAFVSSSSNALNASAPSSISFSVWNIVFAFLITFLLMLFWLYQFFQQCPHADRSRCNSFVGCAVINVQFISKYCCPCWKNDIVYVAAHFIVFFRRKEGLVKMSYDFLRVFLAKQCGSCPINFSFIPVLNSMINKQPSMLCF